MYQFEFEFELGSYWALNERGTDAHLWNDRAGTGAIGPVYTCDVLSAQARELEAASALPISAMDAYKFRALAHRRQRSRERSRI
jgi:hypothetical protein